VLPSSDNLSAKLLAFPFQADNWLVAHISKDLVYAASSMITQSCFHDGAIATQVLWQSICNFICKKRTGESSVVTLNLVEYFHNFHSSNFRD